MVATMSSQTSKQTRWVVVVAMQAQKTLFGYVSLCLDLGSLQQVPPLSMPHASWQTTFALCCQCLSMQCNACLSCVLVMAPNMLSCGLNHLRMQSIKEME